MHSGEAAKRAAEVAGQAGEQPAVYQKRRRRGELMERSFAHGYNRRHEAQPLRGHKNILRWQLIHVGGFNPSLMRQLTGAGTRREWKNRVACLFGLFSCYSRAGNLGFGSPRAEFRCPGLNTPQVHAAERDVGGVKDQLPIL